MVETREELTFHQKRRSSFNSVELGMLQDMIIVMIIFVNLSGYAADLVFFCESEGISLEFLFLFLLDLTLLVLFYSNHGSLLFCV